MKPIELFKVAEEVPGFKKLCYKNSYVLEFGL
jgi:hypothetical protein